MPEDTNPTTDTDTGTATPGAAESVAVEAASETSTAPRRTFQVTKPAASPRPASPIGGDGRYAVIATGGKQYRVKVGDSINVERLHADAGAAITIDQVLLVGGDGATRIGTPVVDGATVQATIDTHDRGEKIIVFKYKPKKRYRRKQGHRQERTRLTITGISV
jgi:large subunit ribosomal protein L21